MFHETSTWSLSISRVIISYKRNLVHVHYNNAGLYVVSLHLACSYNLGPPHKQCCFCAFETRKETPWANIVKGWKSNGLFNKFEVESIYICPRLSENFEEKLKRNDYIFHSKFKNFMFWIVLTFIFERLAFYFFIVYGLSFLALIQTKIYAG